MIIMKEKSRGAVGLWTADGLYVRSKNRRFKNDPYRTVIFTEKYTLTEHFFEYCIPLQCN